ncbi:MAG TPA: N-acetylmuramoyl-L-alanine amidase [Mobilitalea sp.]|nr:N-acetylmuramoyl-L-alanine amidase [Mobilitalea sp.]
MKLSIHKLFIYLCLLLMMIILPTACSKEEAKGTAGTSTVQNNTENENVTPGTQAPAKNQLNSGQDAAAGSKDNSGNTSDVSTSGENSDSTDMNVSKSANHTDADTTSTTTSTTKDSSVSEKDTSASDKGTIVSDNGISSSDKGSSASDKVTSASDKGTSGSDKVTSASDKGTSVSQKDTSASTSKDTAATSSKSNDTPNSTQPASTDNKAKDNSTRANTSSHKKIIAIDAGHQSKGNYDVEPIGPGATTMKTKVSSGTQGTFTHVAEYKLNLAVAKKVKTELINRGYEVVMIREKNDVNLSNKERAEIANKSGADLFIRIHADGSTNSAVNGVSTLYPSKKNPYVSQLSADSHSLAKFIVDSICDSTGAKNRGPIARDDMSGINWCTIPVTIIEMGYMTNKTEDKRMETKDYQNKIVQGICDGIDQYFK